MKKKIILDGNGKALRVNGNILATYISDYIRLTGTAPLSFQASAGSFGYLKQKGVCEQASSPTPSSPVDIYCNNGALKLVDDELPAGYKRIKSITFDSKVWYNTGEKLRGEDTVTITLQPSVTSGQNIFGCYAGTSEGTENYSLYGYGSTSSSWYFRFGGTLYRPKTDSAKRTITVGPGTTTGFSTNVTVASDTFETTSVAWIGALPNSSSPKFKGDLFDSILVGTRLKWIPCERESDGEIGYYEKFSGVFLENQGDGTPVSGGYDTSHFVVVVVGTPEVITILDNIEDDDITDRTGLDSSRGSTITNNNRCYYSKFIQLNEGDTVTIWSSAQNIGGYLLQYSEPTASSGTFYSSLTMSAYEEYGGGYIRYATATRNCYATFQFLGNWEAIKLTKVSLVPSPAQTASVENLLAVGDYQDEQDIISGAITRNVGIVVLDGTEGWTKPAGADYFRLDGMFTDAILYSSDNPAIICSHFVGRKSKTSASGMEDGDIKLGYTSSPYRLYLKYAAMATADDLKDWLAAQYEAGTPVIVLYPLATETTESVAGQSLNTVNGGNVISVTAEVSEVPLDIEYLEA